MSNVVLAVVFVLMLLAPCVIDLSGWWKTDEEDEPFVPEQHGDFLRGLEPPAELSSLTLQEIVSVEPMLTAEPVMTLDELVLFTEREARQAMAAAKQAQALALEASSRAASARARAAAAISERMIREAGAATLASNAAQDAYDRVLAAEQALAQQRLAEHDVRLIHEERRAA